MKPRSGGPGGGGGQSGAPVVALYTALCRGAWWPMALPFPYLSHLLNPHLIWTIILLSINIDIYKLFSRDVCFFKTKDKWGGWLMVR